MFALPAGLWAQPQATPRRIAFLSAFPRADIEVTLGLIRAELEKLGWTDGRNIVLLEPRTAEGRYELLPTLAAEVIAQGPTLILSQTLPATRTLMQAKLIPIVMNSVGNPVEQGIVTDYRKPGRNLTGSSYMASEYARKLLQLLQLLKEAAPGLRSVAVFANPSNEAAAPMVKKGAGRCRGLGAAGADHRGDGPGRFRGRVRRHPQCQHASDLAAPGSR